MKEHDEAVDAAVLLSTGRTAVLCLGLGASALGLIMLLGDPSRSLTPSFAIFRATPGGVPLWGALWLLSGAAQLGLLQMRVSHRFRIAGLWTHGYSAVLSFCFSGAVLLAAIDDPKAGLTGIVTYSMIAALHAGTAAAHYTWLRVDRLQSDVASVR